jgi:hypothetical protein
MKKVFLILAIVCFLSFTAQNKQVLYNFAELPQTLLLNPGAETNYKIHFGVPLLSGFSLDIGSSGFVLSDIFADDGIDINDKIGNVLKELTTQDFVKFYVQAEILSAGFRVDYRTYLSFGLYTEIDAFGYYPKDVFTLLNEGNSAYLNRNFMFSQISYKMDVMEVLHFGVSHNFTNKLTLGARFKLYSSNIHASSNNNTGSLVTIAGVNNNYRHIFSNVNLESNTSGIDRNSDAVENFANNLQNGFFQGNLGVGFDFGLTYRMNDNLEFSGSILDIGFINHKKNVTNATAKGTFTTEGIDFQFTGSGIDYINDLEARFERELVTAVNENSYISYTPIKMNAALKYSFGDKTTRRINTFFDKDFYTEAFGLQLYSVFRPLRPQLALTAFYEKSFANKVNTKVTYTIDNLNQANIGAGISIRSGRMNFHGMIDNLLAYRNLSSANNISLQLGVNVIVN